MAEPRSDLPVRVELTPDGPVLVDGPLEVVLPDGRVLRRDRPVVALCVCRRSRRYPFCDTSHRPRARPDQPDQPEQPS